MLARLKSGSTTSNRAIAAYDAAPRRVERFDAGNDPGRGVPSRRGDAAVDAGFPDQARDRAYEAIQLAERLHHPQSIAYAHFHTGLIHTWLRERDHARASTRRR